jgi:hypothetical protein
MGFVELQVAPNLLDGANVNLPPVTAIPHLSFQRPSDNVHEAFAGCVEVTTMALQDFAKFVELQES